MNPYFSESDLEVSIRTEGRSRYITCIGKNVIEPIPKPDNIEIRVFTEESEERPHIFKPEEVSIIEDWRGIQKMEYIIRNPKPTFQGMNPPPPVINGVYPAKIIIVDE